LPGAVHGDPHAVECIALEEHVGDGVLGVDLVVRVDVEEHSRAAALATLAT
jgi:hypothetical protein